jgi:hypothetical protein
MTRLLRNTVLLGALLLIGCSSPRATTEEEILAGTADTAYAVRDGVTFVLWDVPKFLLWTVPKAVFYDYPRSAVLLLRGSRAQVAAKIESLESGDLTPEEEVAISGDLRSMTGLPIRSTERWVEWWIDAENRPAEVWREDFVTGATHDLEARDYYIRSTAIEDLSTMYGTDLGYDPKGTAAERADSADRWREYVREKGLPPLP